MKLVLFALADYASVADGGKLNVMGIFHTVNAKSFPAKHREMYVIVKFAADFGDVRKESALEINILDEDSRTIARVEGTLAVDGYKPDQQSEHTLIVRLVDIEFPKAGTYAVNVCIDGEEKETLQLYLRQRQSG